MDELDLVAAQSFFPIQPVIGVRLADRLVFAESLKLEPLFSLLAHLIGGSAKVRLLTGALAYYGFFNLVCGVYSLKNLLDIVLDFGAIVVGLLLGAVLKSLIRGLLPGTTRALIVDIIAAGILVFALVVMVQLGSFHVLDGLVLEAAAVPGTYLVHKIMRVVEFHFGVLLCACPGALLHDARQDEKVVTDALEQLGEFRVVVGYTFQDAGEPLHGNGFARALLLLDQILKLLHGAVKMVVAGFRAFLGELLLVKLELAVELCVNLLDLVRKGPSIDGLDFLHFEIQ